MLYFYFADQDFILGKTEGNNRFTHYSYKKDTVDFIPYIPKQNFTIYERFEPYVYRSSVAVNKQKGLIAAFPILLGSIDFFDLDGKLLRSTYFDDPDKLKPSVIEKNNVEAYFYMMDSDSDQNYIYGLNINNRRSDLAGNNHKILNVLVFDWNGKPVIKYILDNDQASEAIAFDSKHNRFYTYCRDCEESNILVFNIPE